MAIFGKFFKLKKSFFLKFKNIMTIYLFSKTFSQNGKNLSTMSKKSLMLKKGREELRLHTYIHELLCIIIFYGV
jgi:hypothetical protein